MGSKTACLRRGYRIESLETRRLLSTATWIAGSGSWSSPGNWSTGVVPQPGDDVVFRQPGSNFHITLTGNASVNSISIQGDTLEVAGGQLQVTGTIINNGSSAIVLDGGSQVTCAGYTGVVGATLSVPTNGALTDPTSNILTNSGFESPVVTGSGTVSPSGWPSWGTAYLSSQFAYAGAQSLQASGANSGVLQSFSVTPGSSYTLSADAMTPSANPLTGSEAAYLQLIFYDAAGNQLSSYSPPNAVAVLTAASAPGGPLPGTVGNQGWNHFSTTAVAPAGAAKVNAVLETGAYNGSGPGGGTVYWDNPQFGPASPGPAQFVAGSIENSGTITIGPSNLVRATGTFTSTNGAVLDIEIGGAPSTGDYGMLSSAGSAALAGAIEAQLVNGYTPSTTDTFIPIQFPGFTGGFSTGQFPSSTEYRIQAAYTFTNLSLTAVPTTTPSVTIDASTALHPVATSLLGVNLAWWDGSLPTTQTQQLVEAAGLTTYRFPGGSSSDDYHFNVPNNYFNGEITLPRFAQLIQSVNGSGLVTLDYGSGSPQEAAAELAYLQGAPTDTTSIGNGIEWSDSASAWQTVNWQTVGYWASLRAALPLSTDDGFNFLRIDHPTPFAQVKYWEVGNEEYGGWETDHHGTAGPGGSSTGAQHDPTTYANFAKQFGAYAMEVVSAAGLPAISIGIDSGDPTGASDNNWTRDVLAAGNTLGFVPNFISDHSYMQSPGSENDSFLLNNTVTSPSSIDDWSTRYSDYEAMLEQTVGGRASSVQVMATEFNSVYTNPGKQSTSLVNGLFIANSLGGLLNSGYSGGFVWDLRNGFDSSSNQNSSETLYGWRLGGDYGMLGDPGNNSPPTTGPYIQYPNYFAEQLASQIVQAGGQVVPASSSYSELNVYSVLEANGHLRLFVVNANPGAALNVQFTLAGFQPSGQAQCWQYGKTQDTSQSQSPTGAAALANFSTTLSLTGANFNYVFDAYSMTVIDLSPAPGIINASGVTAPVRLEQDAGRQHIDWTLGAVSGQVLITATAGLTIGGADTINLDPTNGNALPNLLHLNGTFTINGLMGTNPLASTDIEIGTSRIFIAYTSAASDPLVLIRSYLKNGYNNGAWNGVPGSTTGVITSTAAASNAGTSVGYADSADSGDPAGLAINTIEIRYTQLGDTNLDGTVGIDDYNAVIRNFGVGINWDQGDVTHDSAVSINDYNAVVRGFGTVVALAASAADMTLVQSSVAVEPVTLTSDPAAITKANAILMRRVSTDATNRYWSRKHPTKHHSL